MYLRKLCCFDNALTNFGEKAKMMKVALILSAVVVAATATSFLQLGDDDTLGDVDVEISVRGGQKTLTYRTPNGNVLDVTHVLKSEGVIVNIPGDQEVCNIRPLQKTSDDEDEDEDRSTCKEREPMTDEDVPPRIAEICRGKAVFAEKYSPCKSRARRGFSCRPTCRSCNGGICCGVECTWTF